jgi:hypothetical protein
MMYAPPLAEVTGAVEPGEAFGGFGPTSASAVTWVGACVGNCGRRPGCRPDSPRPECSGCARTRHGITHDAGAIGTIGPVPARVLPGELDVPYRVLVTGSRTWDDAATIARVLDGIRARIGNRMVVVHGHCPDGGDAIADAWALANLPRPPERWPAPWAQLGKSAGPRRNLAMVASRPDETVAFLRDPVTGRGAQHCATASERAGIPTTRYIYGEPRQQPDAAPTARVLRPATVIDSGDASLPTAVRGLLKLAGPAARVTAAVAARADGSIVASLAVRVPGIGYAVYTRGEDGAWGTAGAVLADPHLRAVGVTRFAAALSGVEYVPPAPRPAAAKMECPGCGAEVSVTGAGVIYKSHKCKTGGTEGRS